MTPRPLPDPADPSTVLLFDLDGTVTDSFEGISRSFVHALTAMGEPEPTPEFLQAVAGPPLLDSMRAYGFGDDDAQRAVTAYRERYMRVGWRENRVYDGMASLLADLAAQGRTSAIATSKHEATAHQILEHFGLAGHFTTIAGSSEDNSRRTKTQVIARALDELGTDPRTDPVVMIGDRSHDVEGAAEFGIGAVAVGWGYASPGEVDDAAWSVDHPAALRTLLGA